MCSFVSGGPTCVTHHRCFAKLCLDTDVLRTALVSLIKIRCDTWIVDPPNNRLVALLLLTFIHLFLTGSLLEKVVNPG